MKTEEDKFNWLGNTLFTKNNDGEMDWKLIKSLSKNTKISNWYRGWKTGGFISILTLDIEVKRKDNKKWKKITLIQEVWLSPWKIKELGTSSIKEFKKTEIRTGFEKIEYNLNNIIVRGYCYLPSQIGEKHEKINFLEVRGVK